MRRPTFLLLIGCALLLSCSSVPPKVDIQSEIDVPEQWPEATESSAEVDSAWWNDFNDTGLDSIVRVALARNFDLSVAAARMRSAVAQAKIAGAPLFPQASFGLNGSRRKQNFIGFPIPGQNRQVLRTTTNSYGASLDVSWELDLWGRLRADKAAAVAALQASQADYIGARLSLAAQVAKTWFASIEAKRQAELAQATADNWRLSSEQVQRRYQAGLTTSLDVRLSRSNLALAETNLATSQSRYKSTLRQLEILLGEYPSARRSLADDLPGLANSVPAGLPANLISRRPDLAAAERRLAATHAQIASAKRTLYPRISLTGSTGRSSNQLGDLLSGDFSVWSIVGNLVQPIFQGGRLRANVDLARSSSDAALAEYAQSVLIAFSEVENALADQNFFRDRVSALAEATRQAVAARALAESEYGRGLSDFITMLDAQRSAFNSESQLLAARREQLTARVDLYVALGGGFRVHDLKDAMEESIDK